MAYIPECYGPKCVNFDKLRGICTGYNLLDEQEGKVGSTVDEDGRLVFGTPLDIECAAQDDEAVNADPKLKKLDRVVTVVLAFAEPKDLPQDPFR